MALHVTLDQIMLKRGLGVAELAALINITPANLSILKNGHAKAIRFTTLEALCRALRCNVADILTYIPEKDATDAPSAAVNINGNGNGNSNGNSAAAGAGCGQRAPVPPAATGAVQEAETPAPPRLPEHA